MKARDLKYKNPLSEGWRGFKRPKVSPSPVAPTSRSSRSLRSLGRSAAALLRAA